MASQNETTNEKSEYTAKQDSIKEHIHHAFAALATPALDGEYCFLKRFEFSVGTNMHY